MTCMGRIDWGIRVCCRGGRGLVSRLVGWLAGWLVSWLVDVVCLLVFSLLIGWLGGE